MGHLACMQTLPQQLQIVWLFHRYVQCVDLSNGSAFELPQYQTALNKSDHTALGKQKLPDSRHKTLRNLCDAPLLTEDGHVDDPESHYLEIPSAQKLGTSENKFVISDFLPLPSNCDAKNSLSSTGRTQEGNLTIPMEDTRHHLSNGQLEYQRRDVPCLDSTDAKYTEVENIKNTLFSNESTCSEHKQGTKRRTDSDGIQTYQRSESWSNLSDKLIMPLFETCKDQAVESLDASHKDDAAPSASSVHLSSTNSKAQVTEQKATTALKDDSLFSEEQKVTTEDKNDSSLISHHGIVVGIDNSNIYIGAQECASMVNPGDRKRHVRLKLQNLVRILERERSKMRGFACGSSPPATEHVWEVYR